MKIDQVERGRPLREDGPVAGCGDADLRVQTTGTAGVIV